MSEKQLNQIKEILKSKQEKFDRAYKSFEGPIRVISKICNGFEKRYTVIFECENVRLEEF